MIDFITKEDLAAIQHGREAVGLVVSEPKGLLDLQPLSSLLMEKTYPERLIQGLLDAQGLSYLVGPSSSCKSFMALDLALAVASGKSWCEREVKQGPVVILAGEGNRGYGIRAAAAVKAFGIDPEVPLHISGNGGQLDAPDKLEVYMEEIRAIGQPALIVVDTQARWSSLDENSAKDAGEFIQALDLLKTTFGCHVLVVHHTGKSGDFRGSTAFNGAADTIMTCSKTDNLNVKVRVTKQKDGGDKQEFCFRGREVELDWLDEFDETLGSLVFYPVEDEEKRKSREHADQVLKLVREKPTSSQAQLTKRIKEITGLGDKGSRNFLEGMVGVYLEKITQGNGNAVNYRVIECNDASDPSAKVATLATHKGKVAGNES